MEFLPKNFSESDDESDCELVIDEPEVAGRPAARRLAIETPNEKKKREFWEGVKKRNAETDTSGMKSIEEWDEILTDTKERKKFGLPPKNKMPIKKKSIDNKKPVKVEENKFDSGYRFLNKCRTENKSEVNVFSPMLGSFNISDSSDDSKKLFSMLHKNYKGNKTEHFAEKQGDISGLMIDFDCFQTNEKPQIENRHIEINHQTTTFGILLFGKMFSFIIFIVLI